MTLTLNAKAVKDFELDQKQHGTKTALYNIIYMLATEILHDIGIRSIRTSLKPIGSRSKGP